MQEKRAPLSDHELVEVRYMNHSERSRCISTMKAIIHLLRISHPTLLHVEELYLNILEAYHYHLKFTVHSL